MHCAPDNNNDDKCNDKNIDDFLSEDHDNCTNDNFNNFINNDSENNNNYYKL